MKKAFWFILFSLFSLKTMSQNIVSIKLIEATRGVHKEIFLTEKNCVVIDNSQTKKKDIGTQTWQRINTACEKIELENLSKYHSTSQKRANDAALQATLEITTKTKMYQSNIFDHDNPPKEFVDLIKELKKL